MQKTAKQAILCYDYQIYDACLVMIRRLIETLIIELYERFEIKEQIQDTKGNYLFCSDLIDRLLSEKSYGQSVAIQLKLFLILKQKVI